jgi:hypothetical protein
MNALGSREARTDKTSISRAFAMVGSLLFFALAVKMGTESFHARSLGSLMSNWKGGTMTYQDGFKLTAVFVVFGAFWFYAAIRPKGTK